MRLKPTILETTWLLALLGVMECAADKARSNNVTPEEAHAIAKEAYIYANPMVDNCLPAPKGPFTVVMRLYWPKAEALDGTWKLPALKRVQ